MALFSSKKEAYLVGTGAAVANTLLLEGFAVLEGLKHFHTPEESFGLLIVAATMAPTLGLAEYFGAVALKQLAIMWQTLFPSNRTEDSDSIS